MMKNNKKGFTLVELVIVIAVIAILAGVMIATFSNVVADAQASADLQEVKSSFDAVYLSFVADNGTVPNAMALADGKFDKFVELPYKVPTGATLNPVGALEHMQNTDDGVVTYYNSKGITVSNPDSTPDKVAYKVTVKTLCDKTYKVVRDATADDDSANVVEGKVTEIWANPISYTVIVEKGTYTAKTATAEGTFTIDSNTTAETYVSSCVVTGKNGTEFNLALVIDEDSVNYGSYTITENK